METIFIISLRLCNYVFAADESEDKSGSHSNGSHSNSNDNNGESTAPVPPETVPQTTEQSTPVVENE